MRHVFSKFCPYLEEWYSFRTDFERTFETWGYNERMKAPILLTLFDERTFKLLCQLSRPGRLSTRSYEEICDLLDHHYYPLDSVTVKNLTNLSGAFILICENRDFLKFLNA